MKHKLYYQFAGSCCLLLLFFLGYLVKFYPEYLQGFDQFFTTFWRWSYPYMNTAFLWVTKFADPLPVIILALTFLVLLIKVRKYAEALWLLANLIMVSVVGNPLLKQFFDRTRPELEHLVTEHSLSFPSGHAATSMVFYGTLIFILPALWPQPKPRLFLQMLLGSFILLIGCSRIYLGVHFPSDVLAGFSLALAWLLFTYPIFSKQRFIWRFNHKQL